MVVKGKQQQLTDLYIWHVGFCWLQLMSMKYRRREIFVFTAEEKGDWRQFQTRGCFINLHNLNVCLQLKTALMSKIFLLSKDVVLFLYFSSLHSSNQTDS